MIRNFYYSQFLIDICFESDAFNGAYCHNYFRGVLGVFLKKYACICRNPNQHDLDCNYSRLFESKPIDTDINIKEIPKPYAIYSKQVLHRRTTIEFIIIGEKFQNCIHYFVHSLFEIGRLGLGSKKIRFRIDGIHNQGENILVENGQILRRAYGQTFIPKIKQTESICLNFLTPCWLNHKGEQLNQFVAPVFLSNLIRRVQFLSKWYQGDPEVDWQIFKDDLFNSSIESFGNAVSIERQRFSSRQKRLMPIGGFVGQFTLKNVNELFLPFIELGSIIHVGKKTTFGNGKYKLEGEDA